MHGIGNWTRNKAQFVKYQRKNLKIFHNIIKPKHFLFCLTLKKSLEVRYSTFSRKKERIFGLALDRVTSAGCYVPEITTLAGLTEQLLDRLSR